MAPAAEGCSERNQAESRGARSSLLSHRSARGTKTTLPQPEAIPFGSCRSRRYSVCQE